MGNSGDGTMAATDPSGREVADESEPTAASVDGPRGFRQSHVGRDRLGIPIAELVVLVGVALLPVATASIFYGDTYVAKLAVGLVVGAAGAPKLVALVRARDRAATAAALFLLVVWTSVAVARHPLPAAVGAFNGYTNGLVYTVLVGAWAAGRSLGPAARRLLPRFAIAGMAVTAVVIWLQGLGLDGSLFIPAIRDRPAAWVGNPVFAGALLAGALALVAASTPRVIDRDLRPLLLPLAGVALFAGALNLSGGRQSMAVGLVVTLLAIRRIGWPAALAVALALLVGFGASLAGDTSGATTSTQRSTSDATTGLAPRIDMWGAGLSAWTERPVLGYGPGRFFEAAGPRMPERFARDEGPGVRFYDAHDILVELLVSVGVVGLLSGAGWIALSGRRARGPLALAALAVGLNLLLEPTTVTLLWALVLFGAAHDLDADRPEPLWLPRAGTATLGLGALAAALLLAATVLLQTSYEHASITAAQRAQAILPPLVAPALLEYRAREIVFPPKGPLRDEWFEDQRADAQAAVRADPTNPDALLQRGQIEALAGNYDAALTWDLRALRQYPQDPNVLAAVEVIATSVPDHALVRSSRAHRCRIAPDLAGPSRCPSP